MKLSLPQRIKLGLFGKALLGYFEKSLGEEQVTYYAFKCPIHGIQMDYPHGHDNTLTCPECFKQVANRLRALKKSILVNPVKVTERQKEEPENTLKEKGFISKNKAWLGISAAGLICALIGYKIIKNRKK